MRNNERPYFIRYAALIALLIVPTGASLRADPPCASLLPRSTTAYLACDHFEQLRQAWQRTQYAQLIGDSQMAPFVNELKNYLDHGLPGGHPPLGIGWTDFSALARGQVCLAQVSPLSPEKSDTEQTPAAFALLIDTRGNRASVASVLKKLDAQYESQAVERGEETIGSTTIVSYLLPTQSDKNDTAARRCYFQTDRWLGITNHIDLARDILTRILDQDDGDRDDDRLAALAAFDHCLGSAARPGSNPPGHVRWFVRPFDLHHSMLSQEDKLPGDHQLQLAEQGFRVIEGIGGQIAFAHNSLELARRTSVYMPGALTKVAQMLSFHEASQLAEVPAWVPSATQQFTSVRWDLSGALRGYGALFDTLYGDGIDGIFEDVLVDLRSNEPGAPGVDIRRDLLAHLQPPLFIVRPAKPNGAATDTIYAMQVKNPQAVTTAVRKILEGDPEIDIHQIGPHTVWVFRDRKAPDAAVGAQPVFGPDLSNIAITAANGTLFVVTDFGLLKNVLERPPATPMLANDVEYRRVTLAMKQLGATRTFAHQFHRRGEDLRSTYQQLRSRGSQQTTWLGAWLNDTISRMAADIDFSLLPPFEIVAHHLPSSGEFVQRTKHGWIQFGVTLGSDE